MSPREFAKRRRQLMRIMGKGAIAILPAALVRLRNRDVDYAYRQDSDFHYLTGFSEPESVAVLIPGRAHGEYEAVPGARRAGGPFPPGAEGTCSPFDGT